MSVQASPQAPGDDGSPVRTPTAFRYWEMLRSPNVRRARRIVKTLTGGELFPTDSQARALCEDLFSGDPVAERFVDEVIHGEIGAQRGRQLLEAALTEGIDSIPEAPESMRALFAEFETVPEWVRPELVEQGAAIWRRWGTMLFSFAGAETLEMYTEAAVATPSHWPVVMPATVRCADSWKPADSGSTYRAPGHCSRPDRAGAQQH